MSIKPTYSRRIWQSWEDDYLRKAVGMQSWRKCAEHLKRSDRAVYNRVRKLGLQHPASFIADMSKENWKNGSLEKCKKYCFKKGDTPFNKGKKQSQYMSPQAIAKSAKTRFKKGSTPHNHKPVGYERITKDGYVEVKTAEPNQFELKHRIVWEDAYGPIPKGTNIQFVNGDKTDLRIDNLYSISRQEQIKQNTIHRYPEEVKSLIRLSNKLDSNIKDYAEK